MYDPEVQAILKTFLALRTLERGAQERVLDYLKERLITSNPHTERQLVLPFQETGAQPKSQWSSTPH